MLDSKLHDGYTLYLSCDKEKNIVGGYLKKLILDYYMIH